MDLLAFSSPSHLLHPRQMYASILAKLMSDGCGLMTDSLHPPAQEWKAFGHGVTEGTMAQSEAGRSLAERGVGIVVLIIVTH